MDGVLWYSSSAHEEAFGLACRAFGLPPLGVYSVYAGMSTDSVFKNHLTLHEIIPDDGFVERLVRYKRKAARELLAMPAGYKLLA
ncbi:MAG: hypothetical protein LBE65_05825 [Synergistaceae bacterium]|nr:hypothetical protein [Synergistaceae bacterium]